jgi:hypothetical protein
MAEDGCHRLSAERHVTVCRKDQPFAFAQPLPDTAALHPARNAILAVHGVVMTSPFQPIVSVAERTGKRPECDDPVRC